MSVEHELLIGDNDPLLNSHPDFLGVRIDLELDERGQLVMSLSINGVSPEEAVELLSEAIDSIEANWIDEDDS